jgi:transcriptional regulator with XRE-family HTH domain
MPPKHRHYLKQHREAKGISQAELARRAGMQKSVLSRYESGQYHIPGNMMFLLMELLDLHPSEFFMPPGKTSFDKVVESVEGEDRKRLFALFEQMKQLIKE